VKNITFLIFGTAFFFSVLQDSIAFWDVQEGSTYKEAIDFLQTNNIVEGYSDGSFRAENEINRYDFIKIVTQTLFSEEERSTCSQNEHLFPDVIRAQWFSPYVCLAKKYDIINGYADGLFRGQNPISFAEAIKIVLEGYKKSPLSPSSQGPWYTPYMMFAKRIGLPEVLLNTPENNISRGEMAILIYEMETRNQDRPEEDEPIESDTKTIMTNDGYKKVLTTMFWAGEGADDSNGFISNVPSAWDGNWMISFGGEDDPNDRCGYYPCGFTPKENPFYFALPYNDLDRKGKRKENAKQVPWFDEFKEKKSIIKNQWIEVRYNGESCYGQWQDVGPFQEDDFDYVFGDSPHKNTQGVGAGLDLSPAFFTCLGLNTNREVEWRFVEKENVPEGPWKEIITTSDVQW
jgi:hypothetical protein